MIAIAAPISAATKRAVIARRIRDAWPDIPDILHLVVVEMAIASESPEPIATALTAASTAERNNGRLMVASGLMRVGRLFIPPPSP